MPRDYKAEYQRRIARGRARGLSLSQARGHPKANERSVGSKPLQSDDKIEAAIKGMNQGKPLSVAARSSHVSAERLRRFLTKEKLAERRRRRWIMDDNRPRRILVFTDGRHRTVFLDGFDQSSLAGAHHNAVGDFVKSNDIELLQPFEGKSVRATDGRQIRLETDPNELHRIAAMDTPFFHEIYEIISPN